MMMMMIKNENDKEEIGFQFVEKSNINANSKDTKHYKSGVWTLPPRLVMGEKDKKKREQ